MSIKTLLADTVKRGATNLYLSAGNPPVYRTNGTLYPVDGAPVLAPQEVEILLEPYLTPEQRRAAWGSDGVRGIIIRWEGAVVEGQAFTDRGHLAAAFYQVICGNRLSALKYVWQRQEKKYGTARGTGN